MAKEKTIHGIKGKEIIWERICLTDKTYLVTSDMQRKTYFLYELLEEEKLILANKGPTPVVAQEVLLSDRKCRSISK